MVKIRLRRTGAKNRPSYRVVVSDSRSPRDGRMIDILGHYAPLDNPATVVLNNEKAASWIAKGAQPSDTVRRLLVKAGVLQPIAPANAKATGKTVEAPKPAA